MPAPPAAAHTLGHFFLIFFGRHWLPAVTNAAVTILMGLELLRAPAFRADRAARQTALILRRLVWIVALWKGTFLLVVGDSMPAPSRVHLVYGAQIPDPVDVLLVNVRFAYSVWHPTTATQWTSLLLVGAAAGLLLVRAAQLRRYARLLALYRAIRAVPPDEVATRALARAGAALGFSPREPLPTLLLADVAGPTPLLLGVRRPVILLTPAAAAALTPDELEMALRHELAHYRRRDHWWRWPLACLEDIARPTTISHLQNVFYVVSSL